MDTHHRIQNIWKIASDSFKNVRYDNGKNHTIFNNLIDKVPNFASFARSFELSLKFCYCQSADVKCLPVVISDHSAWNVWSQAENFKTSK